MHAHSLDAPREITDAYAHCGLRKYKPVEDLRRAMNSAGVRRTVLVEHRGEFDHSYIAGLVKAEPKTFAGVFLVDMDDARASDEITRWTETRQFRGIRMALPSVRTHRALWTWAAQLKLNFVVDGQLDAKELAGFCAEFPRTPVVFTHLAARQRDVLQLARLKNVHVQISGMHQQGKAPYAELVPWIAELYKAFGPDRLLYGSNFPVMGDDEIYRLEIQMLRDGKLGIPSAALPRVMDANAKRLWFPNL